MKPSRNQQRVTAYGLVAASLVGAYFLVRPDERDMVMKNTMDDLGNNRAEKLYALVTRTEQDAGLTKEKWIALYGRLIEPRLRRVEMIPDQEDRGYRGASGGASRPVKLSNGVTHHLVMIFDFGNDGNRANLMSLLGQAWAIEYLEQYPKEQRRKGFKSEAFYWGLRKDLTILKEIGVTKFVYPDPLASPRTWEEILRTQSQVASSQTPNSESNR